jgi:hypothetical protein
MWPDIEVAYQSIWTLAHILENSPNDSADRVRTQFTKGLTQMHEEQDSWGTLLPALQHFLKVTDHYFPHLFACYDIPEIPKTDNGLEQFFGRARHSERRATGRKKASPSLIVYGTARVIAAVATQEHEFSPALLRPLHLSSWYSLRSHLALRHQARCEQFRFRKHPQQYLASLESRLLTLVLPS